MQQIGHTPRAALHLVLPESTVCGGASENVRLSACVCVCVCMYVRVCECVSVRVYVGVSGQTRE